MHLHWGMVACMVALTLIGIAAIAGSEMQGQNASRQMIWLAISLVAFILAVGLNPSWLRELTPWAYAGVLILLLLLPVLGVRVKGAASWYDLGPVRFQPSEFMKIAVVLLLAHLASRRPESWRTLPGILPSIGLALLPVLLIARQPDLGTAATFVPIVLTLLYMGGARIRHLILLGVLALACAAMVYPALKPYQRQRLLSFVQQGSDVQGRDYNITQARITLGSGQMWGRQSGADEQTAPDPAEIGVSFSRTELKFLPEAHTDFIYASLGERTGFIGCAVVILLYALIATFGLSIAAQARTFHGALVVIGLLAILLTHVVFNLGMCLSLLPVTGLPLPLVSYGGSSLLANFLIGGLICNVAARRFELESAAV